jgi:two-component system, response regulator
MTGPEFHILLVEDNADHAELLRRNLESAPFACRLHQVEDGESALDYIFGRKHFSDRAQFPAPQLVLLDLRLPRLDGMEVLRHVKGDERHRDLPVVVLTTSDAECDLETAIRLQANRFLTKPVDGAMLTQLIHALGIVRESLPPAAAPSSLEAPRA